MKVTKINDWNVQKDLLEHVSIGSYTETYQCRNSACRQCCWKLNHWSGHALIQIFHSSLISYWQSRGKTTTLHWQVLTTLGFSHLSGVVLFGWFQFWTFFALLEKTNQSTQFFSSFGNPDDTVLCCKQNISARCGKLCLLQLHFASRVHISRAFQGLSTDSKSFMSFKSFKSTWNSCALSRRASSWSTWALTCILKSFQAFQ